METQIAAYLELIKNDYLNQISNQDMNDRFVKGLHVVEGKKYMKVVTGGSVHSFIVKESDDKFKKGDILKAASWNAPAKNKARGNIYDENIMTSWTGAFYLK
jgi:hypothetical protein